MDPEPISPAVRPPSSVAGSGSHGHGRRSPLGGRVGPVAQLLILGAVAIMLVLVAREPTAGSVLAFGLGTVTYALATFRPTTLADREATGRPASSRENAVGRRDPAASGTRQESNRTAR